MTTIASEEDLVKKIECDKNIKSMLKELKPIPLILERVENLIKTTNKIEEHVEKTNGRVRKLETWRSFLLGGWAVISLLFPIMFFYLMSNLKYEVKEIISNQVSTAIDNNNDKYFEVE